MWSGLGNCADWICSDHFIGYSVMCVNIAASLTQTWVQSCPKCKFFWPVWRNRYLTNGASPFFCMTCSKAVQCLKPSPNYVTKYSLKANLGKICSFFGKCSSEKLVGMPSHDVWIQVTRRPHIFACFAWVLKHQNFQMIFPACLALQMFWLVLWKRILLQGNLAQEETIFLLIKNTNRCRLYIRWLIIDAWRG